MPYASLLSLLFFRVAFVDRKMGRRNSMEINTRRNFVGKLAAMAAFVTGGLKLFSQQSAQQAPPAGCTRAW